MALLSFSTKGSATHKMPEKVIEAFQIIKQKHPGLAVDGELQFDAAFLPDILEMKTKGQSPLLQAENPVNTFVFPDLNAGNIGYKLVQRLVPRARAIGPVITGLSGPSNDLSRGCSVEDVKDMVWLTAAMAQRRK